MKMILTGAGGALGGSVAAALSSAGEALILLGSTTARSSHEARSKPASLIGKSL